MKYTPQSPVVTTGFNYTRGWLLCACALIVTAANVFAQGSKIYIPKEANALIPISLSGYSGEVAKVLRFDLEVAGFEITEPEAAAYNVAGNNAPAVEGQVAEHGSKTVILENRRYSGGTLRSQAHAFADDIILKITGTPGIARTKIAFKGQVGSDTEIYVADYDGANAVAVTSDHALVAAPCWAPGHRILYYTSYKSGFPDIYSQNLDTGERRVIARYPGVNTSAAVSADANHVALILSKAGSPDLYVCDAIGGNLKQLTKTREEEFSPCWSPDNRTICFGSRKDGSPALYTISRDGTGLKRLPAHGIPSSVAEPDWSPDSHLIIFTAIHRRSFELLMVPATGGDVVPLVTGSDASWAPNSRTVVFSRIDERGRAILSLLDVQTKRVKDVAITVGSCSQPSWAR